jgi:DHA1 family tetracycline resistance protein-like MFS transporter
MQNRKPAIGFIFITLLIDVIGFGIIIPVLPELIMELTGGSLSDASVYGGWMLFAYAAMQFIFSPVFGGLSDKYGRRPVLLISLFGFGIDYILLAFAPNIAWLFIGRIIAGITGASFTTASAYIADVSTPENRAQNFGMIGAAFGIGFIVGPMIGGLLGELGDTLSKQGFFTAEVGRRLPFYAAAIFTLLNWLYGYFVLPESLSKENRRPFNWKRANPIGSLLHLRKYPVISGLVGSLILIYISAHAVQSTWAYFTMERFEWSKAMVGYSLALSGLLVGLVQGVLIRYTTPKLGEKKSVFTGLILYALGLALFSVANQTWMMFAILIPYCLGGICGPALQSIIAGQVPPNEQGELQGALTSLMSVTSVIGPPLMTNLFAHFTAPSTSIYFPGAPFLAGSLLIITGAFLAAKSLKKKLPKVS